MEEGDLTLEKSMELYERGLQLSRFCHSTLEAAERRIELLNDGLRNGLRLTFEDQGPGIADVALALSDGYTSGNGMGLGLGGARRLVNEFDIVSAPGQGTRVTITRWK